MIAKDIASTDFDDRPMVVFDTDCVLCSGMVGFILAHERDHDLRFASAWSDAGGTLAGQHGFSRADLDRTFLVVANGAALARSRAWLEILRHLKAPWRWMRVLGIFPERMLDIGYDAIARNRYRLFGKRQTCYMPPPNQRDRFIGIGETNRS